VDDVKPVELQEPLAQLARDPTRFSHDLEFPPPDKIRVYDDTLRDGEQMPGVAIAPKDKYELARLLSDIGIHIMDAGFPSVSESERETLRLVLEGRRRGELRADLEVVCMMRSTKNDIDATMRVIDGLGHRRDEVTYFIFTSASDLHVKYKLGKTLLHRDGIPESEWLELPVSYYREANLRMMCEAIRYAREQGATSIEFGGEDGSRADVDYIGELHREGLKAGGTRPSTPDTVGCYSPFAVREYIPAIKAAAPGAPLVVHFHNDLGLGAWNTVMALGSGAEVFTTSVNGIGERTGNAPMHQVLMQLRHRDPGLQVREAARPGAPPRGHQRDPGPTDRAGHRAQRLQPRIGHPHGRHAHPPGDLPVHSARQLRRRDLLRLRQALGRARDRACAA
jgi:isopropylmalate/homocitrate/citramalate synthase